MSSPKITPRDARMQELFLSFCRFDSKRRNSRQINLRLEDIMELIARICSAEERGCIFVFEGARTDLEQLFPRIAAFVEYYGRLPHVIHDTDETFTLGHPVQRK